MEIKAADVMKLRKATNAGMMDCKHGIQPRAAADVRHADAAVVRAADHPAPYTPGAHTRRSRRVCPQSIQVVRPFGKRCA